MKKEDFLHKNKEITNQLIELLNEWDFLEVMSEYEKPYDEYWDLIDPLLSELEKDISEKELEEFLKKFISDTYGVTPSKTDWFSKKVMSWWGKGTAQD